MNGTRTLRRESRALLNRAGDESVNNPPNFFHLHLISDATGETLITVAHAAAAQYTHTRAIEHVHPMVRTGKQLEQIIQDPSPYPTLRWNLCTEPRTVLYRPI